jgi:hypothetical protein
VRKDTTTSDENLFGEVQVPEEASLTACYRSRDWRDGMRLTFFDLAGTNETPFFPGFRVESAYHIKNQ